MKSLRKLPQPTFVYEPGLLKVLEEYKPGEPLDGSKLHLSKISWPPEALGEIHEFIRKGDLNILVQLLEKHPIAIAYPIVFWQIWHLSQLLKRRDEEKVREDIYLFADYPWPGETILTGQQKQHLTIELRNLLHAWVSRMLPGFRVAKRPGKRKVGPKPKLSRVERDHLFLTYGEIEAIIAMEEFPPSAFKRKINETDTAFRRRAKALVFQIDSASSHRGDLTTEAVNAIVKYATQKTTKSISRQRILYGLVAFYEYGLEAFYERPDSVRGIIERKKKPAKSRRRSRHNSSSTSRR